MIAQNSMINKQIIKMINKQTKYEKSQQQSQKIKNNQAFFTAFRYNLLKEPQNIVELYKRLNESQQISFFQFLREKFSDCSQSDLKSLKQSLTSMIQQFQKTQESEENKKAYKLGKQWIEALKKQLLIVQNQKRKNKLYKKVKQLLSKQDYASLLTCTQLQDQFIDIQLIYEMTQKLSEIVEKNKANQQYLHQMQKQFQSHIQGGSNSNQDELSLFKTVMNNKIKSHLLPKQQQQKSIEELSIEVKALIQWDKKSVNKCSIIVQIFLIVLLAIFFTLGAFLAPKKAQQIHLQCSNSLPNQFNGKPSYQKHIQFTMFIIDLIVKIGTIINIGIALAANFFGERIDDLIKKWRQKGKIPKI